MINRTLIRAYSIQWTRAIGYVEKKEQADHTPVSMLRWLRTVLLLQLPFRSLHTIESELNRIKFNPTVSRRTLHAEPYHTTPQRDPSKAASQHVWLTTPYDTISNQHRAKQRKAKQVAKTCPTPYLPITNGQIIPSSSYFQPLILTLSLMSR